MKNTLYSTIIWNNLPEILDYNGYSDYVKDENTITFYKSRYAITLVNSSRILRQVRKQVGKLSLKCLGGVK